MIPSMRKLVLLLAVVGLFVAACGDDKSSSSSTPVALTGSITNKGTKEISGDTVNVEMTDFAFNPTFLKGGKPGAVVKVHLNNTSGLPHTFTSSAFGVDETVAPGTSLDVTITLPQSGATQYHCRFHIASNGMQGAFFFSDGDTVNGGPGQTPTSPPGSDDNNQYIPN